MSGRFYKTARAQHMDYAMKYPSELLFKAIAKKDAEIDQEIQSTEQIRQGLMAQEAKAKGSLGRGMYPQQDEEDYKAEVGGFEAEIGEITQSIYDDAYGKSRMREISDVRSRVAASMTTGNLAMFNKNFNAGRDFLETNKDIDPAIVAAAYKEGIDNWGKTIDDKTGEYRTLKFRDNLQDADIPNEAYDWARGTSNTLGTANRTALTEANLKNDRDVMRTLWQNAELGLLPITEGTGKDMKVIAPQDASEEQMRIAIDKEIKRQADLAVATTMKYEKVSGKKPKEDKTVYAPDRAYISPEGTGLTRQSVAGRAIELGRANGATSNEEAIQLYKQEVDKLLASGNVTSGAQYFELMMKSAVLEEYITIGKTLLSADNIPTDNPNIIKISKREQYFDALTANNTIPVVGGWGDRFEKEIYTQAVKSVNNFIKDKSRFNNTPLEDNMGRFNGKSPNDMIDSGVIRPLIENPKYIKAIKEKLFDDYAVNVDNMKLSKKNGKHILILYADKGYIDSDEKLENKLNSSGYDVEEMSSPSDVPSYRIEVPLPELVVSATEYENFEILDAEPIPTLTVNSKGGNYFRKPAVLDGEIIDLYIDAEAVGDNDYLEAENAEKMDNYLSTLHSEMRAEQKAKGLPENFRFTLIENENSITGITVTSQGFVVSEVTIDETTGKSTEKVMSLEDSKRILMGFMYLLPQSYEE
ncbi:MAG: hypothetical protein ACTSQF_00235 [Candidatus Heimdallarchaeaceae archaeon]